MKKKERNITMTTIALYTLAVGMLLYATYQCYHAISYLLNYMNIGTIS